MGRPRLPEFEYEEPLAGEPRRFCSACEKWWPRRIHLYSGLCPNCRRARARSASSPEAARRLVIQAAASVSSAPTFPRSGGGKIGLFDPALGEVVAEDPVTAKALDDYIASATFKR